jgi:hypothetical protein
MFLSVTWILSPAEPSVKGDLVRNVYVSSHLVRRDFQAISMAVYYTHTNPVASEK